MSYVNVTSGESLAIKIGDGGSPEVFAQPAIINTDRAFKITTNEVTTEVPNTSDPTLPADTQREVSAVDTSVDIAGLSDAGNELAYAQWAQGGRAKNVKIYSPITGALTATGPFFLTDFGISGKRMGKVEFTGALKQKSFVTLSAT